MKSVRERLVCHFGMCFMCLRCMHTHTLTYPYSALCRTNNACHTVKWRESTAKSVNIESKFVRTLPAIKCFQWKVSSISFWVLFSLFIVLWRRHCIPLFLLLSSLLYNVLFFNRFFPSANEFFFRPLALSLHFYLYFVLWNSNPKTNHRLCNWAAFFLGSCHNCRLKWNTP